MAKNRSRRLFENSREWRAARPAEEETPLRSEQKLEEETDLPPEEIQQYFYKPGWSEES